MSDPRYSLSVKVVVRDEAGRVLLLRRSPSSKHNPGLWDLAGGKVDPGESFDRAAIREVSEETGLFVELGLVFGVFESRLGGVRIAHLMMTAHVTGGTFELSSEHDAAVWLMPDECASVELCPEFRGFPGMLMRMIS
jgi:8-oxo-dGTP diphosphatase